MIRWSLLMALLHRSRYLCGSAYQELHVLRRADKPGRRLGGGDSAACQQMGTYQHVNGSTRTAGNGASALQTMSGHATFLLTIFAKAYCNSYRAASTPPRHLPTATRTIHRHCFSPIHISQTARPKNSTTPTQQIARPRHGCTAMGPAAASWATKQGQKQQRLPGAQRRMPRRLMRGRK